MTLEGFPFPFADARRLVREAWADGLTPDPQPEEDLAMPGPDATRPQPPMICPACREAAGHPLDVGRISYYCPHVAGGTLALYVRGTWRLIQGIPQTRYEALMERCATTATRMADEQMRSRGECN